MQLAAKVTKTEEQASAAVITEQTAATLPSRYTYHSVQLWV